MARMPRYNKETRKLEWGDADENSSEYQTWKAKLRASGKKSTNLRKAKAAKSASASETLDDETPQERPAPTGPKRAGGANTRPQSMLAPVLPRIGQSLAIGLMAATRNLTGDKAPMTEQEAKAVAIPAIRIADRTAAKYLKKTGRVTPNQEDAALIVLTIVVWLVGWVVASVSNKPRRADSAQQTAQTDNGDLFAGSEPVAPPSSSAPGDAGVPLVNRASAPTSGERATGEPASLSSDDADLFAGSEPISSTGAASPMPARTRVSPAQAAANERFWQAIVPTDRGETLAG